MFNSVMRSIFPFLFLIPLFLTASCATNPVSGNMELMLLSEEKEANLGQQTDKQVVQEYGLYEDPSLNKHLNDEEELAGVMGHGAGAYFQTAGQRVAEAV